MPMLSERVALVTGAGFGIGAETAKVLASEEAFVFVSDIAEERASAIAQEIVAYGGRAESLQLDVTSPSSWHAAVATVSQSKGRLDILVNNAGLTIAKCIEDTTENDWRAIMSVNLDSQFFAVKATIELMKTSAKSTPFGGSIVNMSSVSGIIGTPILAAYTASKAGVRYLSKSIALDFARKGYRIRVNSVHPGATEGASLDVLLQSRVDAGLSLDTDQARRDWMANYPMGQVARTRDVANGVLFLASDNSAYITGTELVIDGGLSAQ
jgi:3(or 17)beta-hydroxysteroid dehydrogenase